MPEAREFPTMGSLPEGALALFGQDAFSTVGWYEATVAAALDGGESACFHVVADGNRILAVLPMKRRGRSLAALTTPYTCLWQPLLATEADPLGVGRALAALWRSVGLVRLDCLDRTAGGLFDGLCQGGLRVLPFEHFGNWHLGVAGGDWKTYLAARPSPLRNGIIRYTRRLMQSKGATFTLVLAAEGLEQAIADYETVYAASWKAAEPHPRFNPLLMQAAAADGTLRLGLLHLYGRPIAAQFWLKHGDWVAMLKVAYDESCNTLSAGNVLSGLILRHLIDQERITEFDFGRGDDAYKREWTGERRQRYGVMVADPFSMSGGLEVGRNFLAKVRKRAVLF